MPPDRTAFVVALTGLLHRAAESGLVSLELTAGELHRVVGDYPGDHRMPTCCSVMRSMMGPGDDEVSAPPSGNGPSLTIRYHLPRLAEASTAPTALLAAQTDSRSLTPPVASQSSELRDVGQTVALVSCVKSKRSAPARAEDLYTSPLFRYMRRYAEQHSHTWFILSAEHGLLHPRDVVAPYERTLKTMAVGERRRWAERTCDALLERLPARSHVIVLAGEPYRIGLEPFLERHGHTVSVPMRGLGFGRQLNWLKRHTQV